MSQTAVAFPLL